MDVISTFNQISRVIEHDWVSCHLATITDDNQIGEPLIQKSSFVTSMVLGPPVS